jgi:hypothetical protein
MRMPEEAKGHVAVVVRNPLSPPPAEGVIQAVRAAGLFLGVALVMGACATRQGRHVSLDGKVYPPLPDGYEIEVYRTGRPERSYVRVSQLDVHLEKTNFRGSEFEDALPELKRQARLSGADAIVDIEERSSSLLETRIYHVRGIGIRYTSPSQQ